jgi:hypothetical protein
MLAQPMFEVWRASCGKSSRGPRFRLLRDALRHVYAQNDGSSYAIRTPDGAWHHFETTGGVTIRRRPSGIHSRATVERREPHAA